MLTDGELACLTDAAAQGAPWGRDCAGQADAEMMRHMGHIKASLSGQAAVLRCS